MTGLSFLSQSLLACSVCWGSDPNSLDGANAAVGLMMLVLLTVLSGFLSFIVYLVRRARRFSDLEETSVMDPQTQH